MLSEFVRCERERSGGRREPLDPTLDDGKEALDSSEYLARGCQQCTNSIEERKLKQVTELCSSELRSIGGLGQWSNSTDAEANNSADLMTTNWFSAIVSPPT